MPTDPNAPATQPDTASGQGGTGGGTTPPAVTPQAGDFDAGTDTTDTYPDSGIGDTGDTDAGAHNPETSPPDTSGANASGRTYATGDTDDHTRDPRTTPPDTSGAGGGGINATANPVYRESSPDAPGNQRDTTTTFGGTGGATAGSPDASAVGSGVNPNAEEPELTNAAYDVGGTKDTTYLGSAYGGNAPAQSGTPAAPTGVTVAAITNRVAVTVSWTPPGNAAATGVVGYIIESNTGGQTEVGKNHTDVEFEQGLIPGQTYTFTVYARTTQGTGQRSAPSAPYTVPFVRNLVPDTQRDEGLSGPDNDPPGAPAAPVATVASATSASVAFTAPASDGGDPITEYTVVSTPGGITKVGTASPLVVTGLTTATAYTFKVKAKNGYGYGSLSPSSNSVTPA